MRPLMRGMERVSTWIILGIRGGKTSRGRWRNPPLPPFPAPQTARHCPHVHLPSPHLFDLYGDLVQSSNRTTLHITKRPASCYVLRDAIFQALLLAVRRCCNFTEVELVPTDHQQNFVGCGINREANYHWGLALTASPHGDMRLEVA